MANTRITRSGNSPPDTNTYLRRRAQCLFAAAFAAAAGFLPDREGRCYLKPAEAAFACLQCYYYGEGVSAVKTWCHTRKSSVQVDRYIYIWVDASMCPV